MYAVAGQVSHWVQTASDEWVHQYTHPHGPHFARVHGYCFYQGT